MGKRVTAVRTHGRDRASGFALVEVMVALVLLSLVATAVLGLFTRGMQATSHLQRTQSAYAVAAEAMEKVRSISAVEMPGGTSGILMGRAKSDVLAVWAAAATIDTAGSSPCPLTPLSACSSSTVGDWDTTVTTSVNAAVPFVSHPIRSGIQYTVTTLIGECYRLAAGSGACTVPKTGTAVRVFRVTVVVGWKPTSAGACGGAQCVFRMSSLVDPHPESNWNLIPKPVANDDQINVVTGDPDVTGDPVTTAYEIMVNDVIGAVKSNPVTKLSDPDFGTADVITSGTAMGMLNYTPPLGDSGTTSLTYMLRDAAGRTSEFGTVNISVYPKALDDDSASIPLGGTVDINVAANDLGTFDTQPVVKIVGGSGPSLGSAVVVNGQIRYKAPTSGSSDSLKYTITDTSGLESAEATVTVSFITAVTPTASNLSINILTSAAPTATDLNILGQTGNDPANKVFVVSGPTAATGWPSPGTLAGSSSSALSYTPVANTIGVYTFTYYVQNVVGVKTVTRKVTLTVLPVATGEATSVQKNQQKAVDVRSNDVPTAGMTYKVGTRTGDACGTVSVDASTGMLTFKAPNKTGSCTVKYTMSKKAGNKTLSASANLVVTVTN